MGGDAAAGVSDAETTARVRALGAAATLLALGGIAAAVLLDPTFSWTSDALSDLGVRDPSAPVFNWGLIFGGAVGVGYAVELGRALGGRTGALRAAVLAIAMVAMAGVGAFDLTEPLHGPSAIGFYGLVTVAFAVDGVVRRATATGRATLAFVPVHVAVWATFLAGWWPVTGLALPELPGALVLAAWVWILGPAPVVGAVAARFDGVGGDGSTGGSETDEH
ncbi:MULTISPECIES: DUF998 domain-containing protein [unclassified Halorubrum]|uniref:DUF998 domain-containing protein n=1 Tax=unclassified Halorubrum TaxID=2642239 RepID=UPI000B98F84A|nr:MULTISPECIES: DUF998 domain-containing protein [unclassified Halorubrum]OYR46017.1 hypothetical protein DJ74_15375 [Halorubrum sp. Ea8]OYR46043.1 hypothetical protein DJ81_03860 [Halorubrum sp. Hd13]